MANEAKIPVFHVQHNQDIELYDAKVREDKLYLNNEKVAQFCNSGVFTVHDKRKKKTRRFKAVIYLDGKAEATKVKPIETIPDSAETLLEPLTDKDRKNVVKREIAKQLGKFKPMETWQFIVILVMLGALIALQFF